MRRLALLLLALLPSMPAAADTPDKTLESLMAEDQLRLNTWLTPAEGIVVGEEVRLTIELSTPRWFAGGTRITLPDIDRVVVLRRNQFATNLSRREADTTWVIQQWQLELYAQRPGVHRIPPITLELAVNDAEAGIVRGELKTDPLAFGAAVPPVLAGVEAWLAAPDFSIEQTFDRELSGLKPGDAFTRTIELSATNLNAMMLPEPAIESLDGLPAYPDLPELEDRSNRGEATAIRRESVTYLVEREGQYRLPEQTFFWWNTTTRQVETDLLPAVDIDAGAAVAAAPRAPRQGGHFPLWQAALLLAGAVLLALLVKLLARQWRATPRHLLQRADRSLRRGEHEAAAALLYQWLNTRPPGTDWLSLRNTASSAGDGDLSLEMEKLLRAAYSASERDAALSGRMTSRLLKQQAAGVSGRQLADLELNPTQPR